MVRKRNEFEEHVQSTVVANELNVNVKALRRHMDTAGIKETELYYDKKNDLFLGYNKRNQIRYLYIVETPRGRSAFFTNKQGLNNLRHESWLYPQLLESATGLYLGGFSGDIPLIEGNLRWEK